MTRANARLTAAWAPVAGGADRGWDDPGRGGSADGFIPGNGGEVVTSLPGRGRGRTG